MEWVLVRIAVLTLVLSAIAALWLYPAYVYTPLLLLLAAGMLLGLELAFDAAAARRAAREPDPSPPGPGPDGQAGAPETGPAEIRLTRDNVHALAARLGAAEPSRDPAQPSRDPAQAVPPARTGSGNGTLRPGQRPDAAP